MTDFKIEHGDVWEVFDPDSCKLLAAFYDERLARHFSAWLNSWRALGKDLVKE